MLITQCNTLLNKFKDAPLDWQKSIRETYGPNQVNAAEQAIASTLAYADKIHAELGEILIRWMPGSIVSIGSALMPSLLPSDHAKVFAQLKSSKRIMQIGGGRGKGIIIFSLAPLTEVTEQEVDYSDPTALVKSLSDVMKEMTVDLKALKEKVEQRDQTIATLQDTIQSQRRQIRSHNQSSWH